MKHCHFALQRELASLKRIGHLLVKYRECWNPLTEAWSVSSAREANCEILILRIDVDVGVSEQVLIERIRTKRLTREEGGLLVRAQISQARPINHTCNEQRS